MSWLDTTQPIHINVSQPTLVDIASAYHMNGIVIGKYAGTFKSMYNGYPYLWAVALGAQDKRVLSVNGKIYIDPEKNPNEVEQDNKAIFIHALLKEKLAGSKQARLLEDAFLITADQIAEQNIKEEDTQKLCLFAALSYELNPKNIVAIRNGDFSEFQKFRHNGN